MLRRVGRHPNIVELLDVYETPQSVVLVVELMAGGELFDRLVSTGPYSESGTQSQMVNALTLDPVHCCNDLAPQRLP